MLQIAKILKSDGTDGGLLISLRGIDLEDIDQREPVYVYFDGLPVPFFIEDIRRKGSGRAVVHVTGVRNLQDSEEMTGRDVWSEAFEEDASGSGAYAGWTVLDKGIEVGTVSGIEPIPGNPCLVVDTASGEVLVPVHEDLVISADPETRRLDLDLPAGLLP